MKLVKDIIIGHTSSIDEGAVVGYYPGRRIKDRTLTIGPYCTIRAGTVIYGGSTIGRGLETGHNAVIREENKIGNFLYIWNNSTIDYNCIIGNSVRIHCNVYIAQYTTIENNVFIAPGVTISNDLHPLCSRCLEGPRLKEGVRIGAGAVILPRVVIGNNSLIAAGAVVTRDVPPRSVVIGNPGRVVKSIYDLKCKTGLREAPYPEE